MDLSSLIQNLFSPERRLFELEGEGALRELALEAWIGREAVSELGEWRIVALSANAQLPLKALLGTVVTLWTTLADGTRFRRTGLVRQAEKLGADGSLARYRLTVVPWLWLATQQRHSQVFQQRTVGDIVEQILLPYRPHAVWRYTAAAQQRIEALGSRIHVAQFRETDYAFLSRLLAEAGLGFAFVDDEGAPSGHAMAIFADSPQLPEGKTAQVKFHRAHSQQDADAVQQIHCHTRVTVPGVAVVAWDGNAKRSLRGHAPAKLGGGAQCPDAYLSLSQSAVVDASGAQRLAEQLMEGIEARSLLFHGQGTVRTFASGTRIAINDCPHLPAQDDGNDAFPLLLDIVEHCGINNLAAEARAAVDVRVGALEAALAFDTPPSAPENGPMTFGFLAGTEESQRDRPTGALLEAARKFGYANAFRACDARRPWRPRVVDASGARLFAAATAIGVQTATVVGPEGETAPRGDAEHHVSPHGEIRIRFPWQKGDRADDRSSRWVRVAQRQAGAGMGWQWLPRIGQEVLVKFEDDDIDQPVVIGALYNGQGEGGIAPTPGGKSAQDVDAEVFQHGGDTAASAQANLAGGHAPAWHGMSADADGHRNAAAMSGFKSREHGGDGFNQLVFDDSDDQLRIQLGTTLEHTQLNAGHLIHQQDNYRGSFRGEGIELRTDRYAAIRGESGVLITTYRDAQSQRPLPTGDNAAGIALIRQAKDLTGKLGEGARNHQTMALRNGDDDKGPLAMLLSAASVMVDGSDYDAAAEDAAAGNSATEGKVPHSGASIVQMIGRGGIAAVAGQSIQLANGKALSLVSGQDTNLAVEQSARLHSGEAIGIAAALEKPGEGDIGLRIVAGAKDIDLQAQQGELRLRAKDDLKVVSANMQVDFAAARSVRVATAGGAAITIEGGNITVECAGPITYKSAQRKFEGPTSAAREMNSWPQSAYDDEYVVRDAVTDMPVANRRVELLREDGTKLLLRTDEAGRLPRQRGVTGERIRLRVLGD
ncbi:type VI secretion system Vgr family protein [Cupriavidus sp. AU9028]|uniref:type VI secretion system Vgr family protein n=1 Tax=Cupriavidus sp. AU9028 TaxID=2871157 RepID=UPI001C9532CB|nr:contractile injection system protein, VgrG/Pvc8 family [Cupriavidus sp. AU9028]MBY4897536.1 type VI secretion system tip protein VgrG [Cupriavidus sp. AU9028]